MRRLLAVALVLCAAPAFGGIILVAPASGTTLTGDRFATISWSGDAALDAEEWEAFLSVDGGRYYSARITPHLGIGIHTFRFCVPNVASDDVRILIRAGDERRETIYELPHRFSIRPSAQLDLGRRFREAYEAPEAARPGDAPVVEWASGGRDGSNVVVRQRSTRGAGLHADISSLLAVSPRPVEDSGPPLSGRDGQPRAAVLHGTFQDSLRTFIVARDVLRLTTRMNI